MTRPPRLLHSAALIAVGVAAGHLLGGASLALSAALLVGAILAEDRHRRLPAGFRSLSSAPQEQQRCAYCHDDLAHEDAALECATCATAYHLDCLRELPGCAVAGCSPPAEAGPKARHVNLRQRAA
ncbi:MAG: hypothetical protein AB7N76_34205 [Planctomycetota bacterium]